MGAGSIIIDPYWRTMDEIFAPPVLKDLAGMGQVVWGRDAPMPADALAEALPDAVALVGAIPRLDRAMIEAAPKLRAVFEVAGSFPDTVDYAACAERGIEVLCCAPGFRNSVAEMALAMTLSGGRGLVHQHEAFRTGGEDWLADRPETDFTLYGATVGFLGFGSIARETLRLMQPFGPKVIAHDPWLPAEVAEASGVELVDFDTLMRRARVLFVTAAPSAENKGMIGEDAIARMPKGALMVLISRAHLVDFPAVVAAARAGHITAAIDVFPTEPVADDDPLRSTPNLILSPHRAAAVKGGRQLIGEMVRDDLAAILAGDAPKRLQRAAGNPNLAALVGVGDAKAVGSIAAKR